MTFTNALWAAATPWRVHQVMEGKFPLTPAKTIMGVSLMVCATAIAGFKDESLHIVTAIQLGALLAGYVKALRGSPKFALRNFVLVASASPMFTAASISMEGSIHITALLLGTTLGQIGVALNTGDHSAKESLPAPEATNPSSTGAHARTVADTATVLRNLRAKGDVQLAEIGPSIGTFRDCEIPAWFIDTTGQRHEFTSLLSDAGADIKEGQSVVHPGLIYTAKG